MNFAISFANLLYRLIYLCWRLVSLMKKIKTSHLIIVSSFLLVLIGLSITTWKMFYFRDMLHDFINNDRHEQNLRNSKVYDHNVIVFFGDSQIQLWKIAPYFGSLPIVNRGISGDWALSAVNRFDKDVLSINPKLLVMLIGTNDLGNGQAIESITDNIEIMLRKATKNNIKIIICSILPVRGEYLINHPSDKILQINYKLKYLSQKYNADYVDFYSKLTDSCGMFKHEFTTDGLHPNRFGYAEMAKIILPYVLNNAVRFID